MTATWWDLVFLEPFRDLIMSDAHRGVPCISFVGIDSCAWAAIVSSDNSDGVVVNVVWLLLILVLYEIR